MKLTKYIPKNPFKYKKTRSISRSDDPSFGSSTTSDSSIKGCISTPTSVLPELSFYTELVHAFQLIDTDGDGKITKEQLESILTRISGGPDPELNLLLNEVDSDCDGCISLEEFGAISSAFGPPLCDGELKDAFDFFDVNHDGKITAEELFNVFKTIGDGRCTLEDCRRMISGVDKNGDGFVCFGDFCVMMDQQR